MGRTQQTGCTSGMNETNRRVFAPVAGWREYFKLHMKRPNNFNAFVMPMPTFIRVIYYIPGSPNVQVDSKLQMRTGGVAVRVKNRAPG